MIVTHIATVTPPTAPVAVLLKLLLLFEVLLEKRGGFSGDPMLLTATVALCLISILPNNATDVMQRAKDGSRHLGVLKRWVGSIA